MANVIIRLEVDRATRRRTVVISYRSDPDALPNEHEEEHRALVEKLMQGGLIAQGDAIVVEREQAAAAAEPVANEPEQARRAIEQKR